MIFSFSNQLLQLATILGAGQNLFDQINVMLFLPQKRMILQELQDEWNENMQIGLALCGEGIERNIHQFVDKDPVEAWRLLQISEKVQAVDLPDFASQMQDLANEFAKQVDVSISFPDLVSIKEHAKKQVVLAGSWLETLSVIEFGEEGKEAWILYKEAETCNKLRKNAAQTLAHIEFLTFHPLQFPGLNKQINESFDLACAFEEDVLCFNEQNLEKKTGKKHMDQRPNFVSFQPFEKPF